uniref:F-box/LRR-repeat protein 25-like n=1 Tax=Erigeron canadensis TaxID=72917 RepID=UPI001CB89951|nr:F-box/LRR-repeat protein 25-like [Erigeron canadensis]
MEVGDEPPKKIKTHETFDPEKEEKDRISLLPDTLIINEILCRLESTKDAIRTGSLSKRWRHLWPLVPSLVFYDCRQFPDFYSIVDKTLTQCQLNELYKFRVCTNYDKRYKSHVKNWIHFAISNNVQQLHLYLRDTKDEVDEFVLEDDAFFVNFHFTRLHLSGFVFKPSGSISWNNLTHLTVSYWKVVEDLIAIILSGSPLLDTLTLDYCYGYSLLNITSKSVKNLVLCGYNDYMVDAIQINAPYISSLTIMGDILLSKIYLQDVSSLVKAELNYTILSYDATESEVMLKSLLLRLKHVKELKIGVYCSKVLSRLEAKGFIFPSNLKFVQADYFVSDTETTDYSDSDTDLTELGDCSDNDSSDSFLRLKSE